ncbi:hypothetical protein ULG90_08310 [Halopseudomonas pachastrellae]|nr:hypothetical protein ULG90_08310 [Halopseudomonas pachastrellae]
MFAALSPAVFIVPVYLAGIRRRPADDKDDVMTNWKVLSALLGQRAAERL